MSERRYRAFLSYSHRDKQMAQWLHRKLESYRFPPGLLGEGEAGRLRPIFKDRDELAASENLSEAIQQALAESDALIVLCSPSAAISPWIAKEIDLFKRIHGDHDVFPAVIDGDPPYNMPPPLLVHYSDGAPSDEPVEPAAADLRPEGDGRKLGVLKLAAGLGGVQLDALVDREARRRNRRMAAISAASLLGMIIAIGLAVFAIQQRDAARAERAEANGLVEYMLTDLREQLEPVGRLEVLDGVGSRAMEYYARQKIENLTPEELGRRAKAVQLVAEIQNLRGNNDEALPAFREAARTTAELLARDPDDPQRMFNHGQSLFWVGYIAWQRGDMAEARQSLQEYSDISTRLAARDRANLDWQMEEAYSFSNLGTLANDEGRYEEALPLFKRSVEIASRVATAEDRPPARLVELGLTMSWLATTQQLLGEFKGSTQTRRDEIALYREALEGEPENVEALRPLIFAEGRLGWLLGLTGNRREARETLSDAIALAERLEQQDPDHTWTKEMALPAYMDRALLNWREGRNAEASRDFESAARLLADLRRRDPQNLRWNGRTLAALELNRLLTDRASISTDEIHAVAGKWIERLDTDEPDHVSLLIMAHIANALAYSRDRNEAAAARAFARAIAVEADSARADVNANALRGFAAAKLGQRELAAQLRAELRRYGVDPAIDDRLASNPGARN